MSKKIDDKIKNIIMKTLGWSAWHLDAIWNRILPAETPGLVLIYDKKSDHITTQHWKLDDSDYNGILELLAWMKNGSYDGHSTWGIDRNVEAKVLYSPKLKEKIVAKVVHACLEQCNFKEINWIPSNFLHMELQPINMDNRNQHLWFTTANLREVATQLKRIGLALDSDERNFKKLAIAIAAVTQGKTFKFAKRKFGEYKERNWFPVELYDHRNKKRVTR